MEKTNTFTLQQLREIQAAAPDAVAIMAGATPPQPHPLAASLTLPDLAFALGLGTRVTRETETRVALMGKGLSSVDFSSLLARGLQHATVGAYDVQAEHLAFCVPVPVENYQETPLPALDADLGLELLGEGAEPTSFVGLVGAGAVKAQILSFGRRFGFSRMAIINNDLASFARHVLSSGANAARLEARMVAAALEANPNLGDGAAVFDASFSNVVSDALGSGSLGTAMGYLRLQKTAAGQLADLRAKHLVTAPGLEMTARELVRNAGLDVRVTVLSYLPVGRWYLLADSGVHPVVGVLRLLDVRRPVRVEQTRKPLNFDGSMVAVTIDSGACILRRTGIVRGGA